jgi:hypothetical protein
VLWLSRHTIDWPGKGGRRESADETLLIPESMCAVALGLEIAKKADNWFCII